jgi:WD40 repeat protein
MGGGEVYPLTFPSDGRRVVYGFVDESLRTVDVKDEIIGYKDHRSRDNSLAFSPNGETLYTGSQDGTVQF